MGTYAFREETIRKMEVGPSGAMGSLGIIGNTTWGIHGNT
jgi:hypothetical protein